MARRNEKRFFSQLITQRGAEKTTEQQWLRSKSKISLSDNKTAQVPSCQALLWKAHGQGWSHLTWGTPISNFPKWSTITDMPQRKSGQTMQQPSYSSKKHQSAQETVLYEKLGVFSIFQTDLLGYKWVRGEGGSRQGGKEHCMLPPCFLTQHTLPGLAQGKWTCPPGPFVLPTPSLSQVFDTGFF